MIINTKTQYTLTTNGLVYDSCDEAELSWQPTPWTRDFKAPRGLPCYRIGPRDLALVDFALRRRFHAFRMPPDEDVLSSALGEDGELAVQMFNLIQDFVDDEDFSPGHSYWITDDSSAEALDRIWRLQRAR